MKLFQRIEENRFLIHVKFVELNFKLCVALQVQMAEREFRINFLGSSVKCANRKCFINSLDTFFYEERIESEKTGKTAQQSLKISWRGTDGAPNVYFKYANMK